MTKTIIVSSPGKLIIGGEHAVVYGRRALVTSIGMRLYMQLTEDKQSNQKLLHISFEDIKKDYSIDLVHSKQFYPIEIQAIIYVYNHFQCSHSIQLNVHSE